MIRVSGWRDRGSGLRIGGHRGAPDLAPENTLAGLRAAAIAGASFCEIDVHLSADGQLVVIHDDTLDRTTDGRGPVAAHALAELRKLDAGRRFHPSYEGERIPTLDEVLAWVEDEAPAEFGLVIEAKGRGTGPAIAASIRRSPAAEQLAICSFVADELAVGRDIFTVLLFEPWKPWGDPVETMLAAGVSAADVPWQWDEPGVVERMHEKGLAAGGGSASNFVAVERLVRFGADFVDSDSPATALAALRLLQAGTR
jgi:glycerophosphoryl diester phosphodiesterase